MVGFQIVTYERTRLQYSCEVMRQAGRTEAVTTGLYGHTVLVWPQADLADEVTWIAGLCCGVQRSCHPLHAHNSG